MSWKSGPRLCSAIVAAVAWILLNLPTRLNAKMPVMPHIWSASYAFIRKRAVSASKVPDHDLEKPDFVTMILQVDVTALGYGIALDVIPPAVCLAGVPVFGSDLVFDDFVAVKPVFNVLSVCDDLRGVPLP